MTNEENQKIVEGIVKLLEEKKADIRTLSLIFETNVGDIYRNAIAKSYPELYGFVQFHTDVEKNKQIQSFLQAEFVHKQKNAIIPAKTLN